MARNAAATSDSESDEGLRLGESSTSSDPDDSVQRGVKRALEEDESCDENMEPNKKLKKSPTAKARKRKLPKSEPEALKKDEKNKTTDGTETPQSEKEAEEPEPKRPRARKSAKESVASNGKNSRKRPGSSRAHLDIPQAKNQTVVLASGDNEVGQLGLERTFAARFVPIPAINEKIVVCAAGGMHSLLLSDKGNVFSFGCNDEGSLGRPTEDEEDCFKVGPVSFGGVQIAKIAAGNIHSIALSTDCRVFLWGSYRDNSGAFGVSPQNPTFASTPMEITLPDVVVDVACGADHTLMLTVEGTIYTMGCAEHGRLGRIRRSHCCRENRRARTVMLSPLPMRVVRKRRPIFFDRIWASRYCSFARSADGTIWGCGLNNCHQLGEIEAADHEDNFVFQPVELRAFDPQKEWTQICGGEQHTLALDKEGTVYSMGRTLYGRLGLGQVGPNDPDVTKLTPVPGLEKCVVGIAAGDHCSFALDRNGQLLCWGQGSNMLGQGDRDKAEETDLFVPTPCTSKNLKDKKVIHVNAGSNHALCVINE